VPQWVVRAVRVDLTRADRGIWFCARLCQSLGGPRCPPSGSLLARLVLVLSQSMRIRWHKWWLLGVLGSACTLNPQPEIPVVPSGNDSAQPAAGAGPISGQGGVSPGGGSPSAAIGSPGTAAGGSANFGFAGAAGESAVFGDAGEAGTAGAGGG
jgi:hypothetical protein